MALGFSAEATTWYFNLSYLWIVAWLALLERLLPFRDAWLDNDGQMAADLSHTVLNKGLVQLLVVSFVGADLLGAREATVLGQLALPWQVLIGLVGAEFGLYWMHRLDHEWPFLWRFHAVHHSVKRLWFWNTGRFHFVDSLDSVAASLPFLLLSGISMDAIIWVSAITAYIGVLTHCNLATRCGPLNYIFNTPNLHRWHHSLQQEIGNNNYGENLMLWDMIFGTFYHRPGSSVADIGIKEHMPRNFIAQLYAPFVWQRYQAAHSTPGNA